MISLLLLSLEKCVCILSLPPIQDGLLLLQLLSLPHLSGAFKILPRQLEIYPPLSYVLVIDKQSTNN